MASRPLAIVYVKWALNLQIHLKRTKLEWQQFKKLMVLPNKLGVQVSVDDMIHNAHSSFVVVVSTWIQVGYQPKLGMTRSKIRGNKYHIILDRYTT
jgi:hypothetical protein